MATNVFCLADNESQAVSIVSQLKSAGFSDNDISVLFPDKTGTRDFAHEQHTKAPEALPQVKHVTEVLQLIYEKCKRRRLVREPIYRFE